MELRARKVAQPAAPPAGAPTPHASAKRAPLFSYANWASFLLPIYTLQLYFFVSLVLEHGSDGTIREDHTHLLLMLPALTIIWAVIAILLAHTGVLSADVVMRAFPGFWVPLLPMLSMLPVLAVPQAREGLKRMVIHTYPERFIALQCGRMLALRLHVEYLHGRFPRRLMLWLATPNAFFGMSACGLYYLQSKASRDVAGFEDISLKVLGVWNVVGVLAIVPVASLAISSGRQEDRQAHKVLFRLPLALGPTLVLPLFIAYNALVAWVYLTWEYEESR